MKKNLHLIVLIIIIGGLCISGVSGVMYHGASPGGKTGSPIDKANCTQCHQGSATTSVDWITSNIPETGWKAGETYTITATAVSADAKKIGFELTAENSSAKAGTFVITDATRTQLGNKNASVTHTTAGNPPLNGQNQWQMNWTAPATNDGDITFYAAFNCANGDGTNSGDGIFLSQLKVSQQATATAVDLASNSSLLVYPNPAQDVVTIESPKNIKETSIYNTNGQKVKTFYRLEAGRTALNIGELSRGSYLLKTTTEDGEFTQRIQLN